MIRRTNLKLWLTKRQTKRLSVRGKLVHLKLLDTAGQERFRLLSSAYYRLAHGIILVYDVTDRASFQAMDHWYNEVRTHALPEAVICLVGSKIDMEASRQVSTQEGSDFALQHGLLFCELSSKANQNVKTPFLKIVDKIISTPGFTAKGRENKSVQLYDKDPKESSQCAC